MCLTYDLSEVYTILMKLMKLVIHFLTPEEIRNVNLKIWQLLNVQISKRMHLLYTLAF